ncbi:hypothetical protein QTO34_009335 [Cnephaeus nilssonii]|uniref:Uncharacterized protein n=1 Tax=Cnephaeus nilssonii TaxID=3371016 RepID=A0AA40LFA4_CNENI|nr:hypothetical protein QTO34_009335 [Eptesicus nilssonii]
MASGCEIMEGLKIFLKALADPDCLGSINVDLKLIRTPREMSLVLPRRQERRLPVGSQVSAAAPLSGRGPSKAGELGAGSSTTKNESVTKAPQRLKLTPEKRYHILRPLAKIKGETAITKEGDTGKKRFRSRRDQEP